MSRVARRIPRSAQVLAIAVLGGVAASTAMYNVDAGHRAVLFDRFSGIKPNTVPEGTHFLIPGIQKAFIMDVRTQPRTISAVTGTKDLQTVNLSLRVLTRPNTAKLAEVYSKLGMDYSERVLPSICNEVLKAVVALYDAAELLTLRDQVSARIREQLQLRASEFNIVLDDVSITHLTFSRDFAKAIEDKQVAEQMAERAKFIVMSQQSAPSPHPPCQHHPQHRASPCPLIAAAVCRVSGADPRTH